MIDHHQELSDFVTPANAAPANSNELKWIQEGKFARMANYLNSNEFLDNIQEFGSDQRGSVMGVIIEYFILHPDGYEVDRFMEEFIRNKSGDDAFIAKMFTDSIARRLGFTGSLTPEQEREIYNYYVQNVFTGGVYFHGFNGVFEEAIRNNGLTKEQRLWHWDDIERVNAIGAKSGHAMLLGWSEVDSKNRIAYAATARSSYRYAVASPEWFSQFVSEGNHIPNEPKRKEAYYRGDYETAKQNIIELCDSWQSSDEEDILAGKAYPNITQEEGEELLSFFEKYWQVFRGQKYKPKLALIRRIVIDEIPYITDSLETTKQTLRQHEMADDITQVIGFLRGRDQQGHYDERSRENIMPEDIEIVDLPEYNVVFPRKDI